MTTLHMICGLPGSGKSTLAKQIEKDSFALRLTPDEWMINLDISGYDEKKREAIESLQWSLAQRVLSLGVDVVLESGFWIRDERNAFRKKAGELGAKTKLYYLDVPLEELWQRIENRNKDVATSNSFLIKKQDLEEWFKVFQPPTAGELE